MHADVENETVISERLRKRSTSTPSVLATSSPDDIALNACDFSIIDAVHIRTMGATTTTVFPEPFGPSSPYITDQTERDRRFTARFSPYSLVNSSADIVSIGSTCPTTDL